ncbi:2-phospho-L-lactate transferase [Marisediminicola senii]|uniref:2-phospho-L-lactate transferase n=1 Tax=Marisediminicola senii TaxID=2711233 RepID=UPI0013EA3E8D|nr:2-phospho-L-lactate transferase [Marisediminicola senii]
MTGIIDITSPGATGSTGTAGITVLAGGVGGARFVRGLRELLSSGSGGATPITVIANTGDDMWLTGLRVCPDLDSLMYTLGGANDEVRGWGRAGETERVSAELTAYGVGWPWFTLGDLDLSTHIARTSMLRDGLTLTEATARIAERWQPGVTLLPATDDEVETHVEIVDPETGESRPIHFEEWWVRHRAQVPAVRFINRGIERARATDAAASAIADAEVVLLAPSNPVVSIGTIVALPGIAEALRSTAAPVVGVSPIIGGSAVRGMADACLRAIGVETSALAVGEHYGARSAGGIIDGWLVGDEDVASVPHLSAAGIASAAAPLWMTDVAATAAMADAALALASRVAR